MSSDNSHAEGRYLYCIVNSGKKTSFGQMGIEDSLVYTVLINDIGAVVHRCEAKPYKTEDKEKAGEWILTHQYVIDLATKEFGTVIPLTFDTIFKGDDEIVKQWLREEYRELKTLLEKLDGKAEYGVQIFVEDDFIEKVPEEKEEIQRLRKEIENKPKGVAYLLRKKLERKLELERKALADKHAKNLYDQIKRLVDDVKLDSTKREVPEKWKGKQMILNLACLAHKDNIQSLGNMLGEVNKRDGFAVRFTGPWPPYSFVGEIGVKGR
ncbi:MAG: Gas vesicle synthesis protein GvpL/GvpF [Candidatus Bathyarchaeota archaeon BA2]|nr:MAG: Gas vesicle synthesis protein GvpL/GvpF [Candidatus Bathyarchaeota archaeon BA2]